MLVCLAIAFRALRAPVALGVARARATPSRWALPALGVGLATALLIAAAGGGAVAGEQAARDAFARLSPAERSVRLSWSGGAGPGVNARAVRSLRTMTPAAQTRSVLFLATALAEPGRAAVHRTAQVAAIAPLGRWVRLLSGRLPRSCAPARCEVLSAGGGAARAPAALVRSGTRFVVVGRATLRSLVPLGFLPVPGGSGNQAPRLLLLAGDTRAADALPGLDGVFRTQGWSAPLDTGGRPSWRLGEVDARIRAERAALTSAADGYSLTAPDAPLAAARARASEARDRVLLVAAGAVALLAAFVVLAATALQRDLDEERLRLERRGGRRWQAGALIVTEAAWPALAGVVVGALAGVVATAARAHAADVPVGGLLTHALVNGRTALMLLAVWASASTLLVLATRRWGTTASRAFDVAALGAAGALALALTQSRGGGAGSGETLPALLPPLACLVGGVVVARLARPLLRAVERLGRRGPLAVRLAGLGLGRDPGGPALTIAVVAVGCGLSCFAFAYRATLHGGDRDQAAYQVPLDVTVREGPSFASPLALAPAARWRRLAGAGSTVLPVQRTSASVPRGASAVELPVFGVPARGLAQVHGWRDGDASASRAVLTRRLLSAGPVTARGPVVAGGDGRLQLHVATAGDRLDLTALLLGADGQTLRVHLGKTAPAGSTLSAPLPAGSSGRRLIGVEAAPLSGQLATTGHQEAENDAAPTLIHGRITLGDVRLGGRVVAIGGWRGRGPVHHPPGTGTALTATYAFDATGRALLGPPQPGDDLVVPVVTDPTTAASAGRGGLLPLGLLGERVRARVVGTVARFPTVAGSAGGLIVADGPTLAAAIEAAQPGLARPDELWITASPAGEARLAAALRGPRLQSLDVSSRRADEARLRADPLARELVRTLVAAGVVALLLAALGVLVAVVLALRDDAGELLDLETLGVDPSTLRGSVRLRAAVLAGAGLIAGLGVGGALVALAVDAVRVTAAGVVPIPPLVTVVPMGAWAVLALAFLLASAAGVALITRRALGGPLPTRTAGGPS